MVIDLIDKSIQSQTLASSILICGNSSIKKREIISYIANKLSREVQYIDCKMTSIRNLLDTIQTISTDMIYVLTEIDEAQFRVKYSILKILEEPPANVILILTCSNLEGLYPPILSRCQVYYQDPISKEELKSYTDKDTILDVCETPDEILTMETYNIQEFLDYVQLVIDNITKTSISNIFKIGQKLQIKKDEEGYNLALFLKIFSRELMKHPSKDNLQKVQITSKWLEVLSYPSVNRQMVLDGWLLEISEQESKWN